MGVAENFKSFCNNIVVRNKDTISNRYSRITKRINLDFWDSDSSVSHSLYVGSYGRNTAIHGISDVDMLMEMPSDLYWKYDAYSSNGQSSFLQVVKQSIEQTYSVTKIAADGQVIVVPFDDGLDIEVLPVFKNKDGNTYTFADTNGGGSWKSCNPKAEIAAMKTRNTDSNDGLKWLCRMMRVWKQHNSVSMTSFLIDTLAYSFIDSWFHKGKSFLYYDFLVRDFLRYLSERDRDQIYWRAPGSGQYVYRTGSFEAKAKAGYAKTLEAIKFEDDKMPYSANGAWKELFGSRYP